MVKSILVCTDGSAYGDAACEYAIHIAQRLQAQLAGLHVLDSRMLEGPMLSDISGMLGAQPFSVQLEQFRVLMEEKGESVLQALVERGERSGMDIETHALMGHPARIILEEEAGAELLILGQKGEHAELIGDLLGSNVERIVRRSAKPCLVTPSEFQPITKILAAFDGSAVAGKALHEGIEMAQALNVPLLILTVRTSASGASADDIAETGLKLARAHNCAAARLVVEGRPSEQILAMAHHHSCNLIVIGAYGHSLIREWIIGSTTAHLIHQTDLPVMLVR